MAELFAVEVDVATSGSRRRAAVRPGSNPYLILVGFILAVAATWAAIVLPLVLLFFGA